MAGVDGPRLVTPEAVELRFETAGVGSRMLALIIDLLVQGTALAIGVFGLAAAGATGGASGTATVVMILLLVTFVVLGYPVALEALWRGRTLGKAALGLRVVTTDGAPVRFRHAVVRGFLTLVDLWLTTGAAAVLSILLTPHNQRLGDLAAGTLVLRERSGAGRPQAVRFEVPAGWEPYAATIDVTGLASGEYDAVRAFLLRAPTLPAHVRAQLAGRLATTVAARLAHTPPAGVPAEGFLVCVAALVQARRQAGGPAPGPDEPQAWSPARETWARAGGAGAPPSADPPAGTSSRPRGAGAASESGTVPSGPAPASAPSGDFAPPP